MSFHIVANCFLITAGAVIMLISILGTKGLMSTLHFVPERQQRQIKMSLLLHRTLMIFFLFGYLVVLAAFIFDYSFISETFVSVIFFFGAIFVFIGINVQSRLLSEVQNTLQGILPICCKCNRIRSDNANPKDPLAWNKIEEYLTTKTSVNFSHGLCPSCFDDEMKNLNAMNGE